MLLINSRSNFHAADAFAPSDQVRAFPVGLSAPTRLAAARPLAPPDAVRHLAGQRVLVLVHGYNHTVEDAIQLYQTVHQTVRRRFSEAYDAVVGYTWPAGASRLAYFAAKSRVDHAGCRLRRWLEGLWAAGCTVDIAGHSLGARITTAAVRDTTAFRARHVFLLAAPAGPAALDDVHDAAEHVYVFHTRADAALGRWYWLFEWETPIGYAGLSPDAPRADRWPNVTAVDCTATVTGHYDYLQAPAFIAYLARVLNRDQHPHAADLAPDSPRARPASSGASTTRATAPD